MSYNIVYLHADSYAGENYGNYLQRVVRPCALWDADPEFSLSAISLAHLDVWELALAADLLVIIQAAAVPLEAVIRERRRLQRPTVYEINDDLAFVGEWLPADHGVRGPLNRQHILNLAHCCDALQVSSPGLAQRYRTLHADAFVLDPYVPIPRNPLEKPPGLIIGWTGTTSHSEDLGAIVPTINEFLHSHPDVQFHAMGDLDMLREVLRDLPASQIYLRAFGSYDDLQEFLAPVHIAIAPLLDTGFNRGRSDGKFAQYAASGCVALLSACDVFARHQQHALLFANTQELHGHLQQLYARRTELAEIARPALAWVQRERSAAAVRETMRQQFRRWLARSTPLATRMPVSPDALAHAAWAQALHAAGMGQHAACADICEQMLERDPACHPARWLLLQQLNSLQAYARMLHLILTAPPDNLYADHYASMGHIIARKAGVKDAPDFISRIQSPALRTQTAGVGSDGAETYFRRILSGQAYHYFALFGLHQIVQQRDPHHPEIQDLRTRMDLLAPDALAAGKN